MLKEIWPFNLIDLDNTAIEIPQLPTSRGKKSIVYYAGVPVLVKSKNKILIPPFYDCSLYISDISLIEKEMLKLAKEKNIAANDDNCLHLIKSIQQYVYHSFVIL